MRRSTALAAGVLTVGMAFFPSAAFAATDAPSDPPVKGDLSMQVATDGTIKISTDQPCLVSKKQPGFVGVLYLKDANGDVVNVDEPSVNSKGLWTSSLTLPDSVVPGDVIDVFAFCFPNASDPALFMYNPIGIEILPPDQPSDSPTATPTDATPTEATPTDATPTEATPTEATPTDAPSHSPEPTTAPTTKSPSKSPSTHKRHHKVKVVAPKHKTTKGWHSSGSKGSNGSKGSSGSKGGSSTPVTLPAAPAAPVATPVAQNPTFTG